MRPSFHFQMSKPQAQKRSTESQDLRVSIAMCTFNGERYVEEQLHSIGKQTVLPFELVICDDGSSDGTLRLVRAFGEQAPFPVRIVVNAQRLGSTKNFEKAIAICAGDVISLCDQDDIWYPDRLQTLVSMLLEDESLGGVFSDGDLIGPNGEPKQTTLWQSFLFQSADQEAMEQGLAEQVLFRRSVVTGATLAFRSSLREKLLPIPISWVHDGWLAWMLSMNSKLGLCSKRLIAYRIHPSQQIGAPTSQLSFLRSMVKEGSARYFNRMRLKHIAEYEDTSRRFGDLSLYLRNAERHRDNPLFHRSEAKARYSAMVARAMGMPRLLRFHRILGQMSNYFQYSARPWRLLIRDMIL